MSRFITKNYQIPYKHANFLGFKKLGLSSSFWFSSTGEPVPLNRKDVTSETLFTKYNAKDVEQFWYEWWESHKYFRPTKPESESFVILLPPPNITGTLHLGHVLTATIQDIILRWKRMKGDSVVWVPGIDHAGIATQVAVEKYLKETSGVSRISLGKEEFVNKIWDWKKEKENKIYEQLRSVGASLDWSQMKFTMDPVHSSLVTNSFIKLYNDGLIYRKRSLVNWSCSLKSSISDIEIETVNITKRTRLSVPGYDKPIEFGNMYKIAYKICDEDDEIVVATTRPETMLGDVAVAVNPQDSRYTRFRNKLLWHPFRQEKIPIVFDDYVDPEFGTGAVKITPSHSPDDYEISQRHNLNSVDVINEEGCLNNVGVCEKLHGLKRYDARKIIVDELSNLNLFRGAHEHEHMLLPVCSRSGDVVERLLKGQWFLKSETLAKDAIQLVESGELKLLPNNYVNVWYNWLTKCRDWNLSRQLWWGHEIPMYKCTANEMEVWVPALSLEEAAVKGSEKLQMEKKNIRVIQDPDVLDTWFSSGLLPLNTLPGKAKANKPPISLMVTGHDILFFWVARMVMLTRCLTGTLPFKEVMLHALVCDAKGRKMSKSLGNVVRPEDVVNGRSLNEMKEDLHILKSSGVLTDKELKIALEGQRKMFPEGIPGCGMDALRFSLCNDDLQSGFINFDVKVCHASRDFCNKIWQATRYFLKVMDDCKTAGAGDPKRDFAYDELENEKFNVLDKWIFSRVATTVRIVDKELTSCRFTVPTKTTKAFFTDEFCGVYLECSKSILKEDPSQYKKIILMLLRCIETSLKLLSPFMPFVTEHLYQVLPSLKGFNKAESLMIAEYPTWETWKKHHDEELERNFDDVLKLLSAVRGSIVTYNLIGKKPKVKVKCPERLGDILFGEANVALARLGKVSEFVSCEQNNFVNVIERIIDDDSTAFIEHDYDKDALSKHLGPTIRKEKELRASIEKLMVKIGNSNGNQTEASNQKLKRQLTQFQESLDKIEEFKKVIANCSR